MVVQKVFSEIEDKLKVGKFGKATDRSTLLVTVHTSLLDRIHTANFPKEIASVRYFSVPRAIRVLTLHCIHLLLTQRKVLIALLPILQDFESFITIWSTGKLGTRRDRK